ncbi:MAG TPA: amidase [Trebonia sp.]|jgi:amidase|nr:amidase [Trebonia sp.]
MGDFAGASAQPPSPELLASATVAGLQRALAAGETSALALCEHYLGRIEELNPALHAVITVSPQARADATASDERRRTGAGLGPLDGIPVLVKDNVQVAGMPTTAGSPALLDARPPDAFIVTRLRAAGAVILGKANLSEWANFRSSASASGWSTLGGQAANPYDLDRSPSGSSSGSAVAVAAGLAPLAVGTETDGSIVSPASACGIVGIKPTAGLVSRTGIVPISPVQDTAGPMAACVADAAALLSVLAAADPRDRAAHFPETFPASKLGTLAYDQFLDASALSGARIGIWRAGSAAANAPTNAVLDAAVGHLVKAGAEVTDPVELPGAERLDELEWAALKYEFKYGINAYLQYLAAYGEAGPAVPGTLAELVEFNQRNAPMVLSRFGQETFEAAEATSGDLDDPAYLAVRSAVTRIATEALQAPVRAHGLTAIACLTSSPAWLTDYVLGDHHVFGTSSPAAIAGWPSVTVPAGYVAGLPVGLSFTGPPWSEPELIALAFAFEQATAVRRPPSLAVPPGGGQTPLSGR